MGVGGVFRWVFGILFAIAGIACLASIIFPGGPRPELLSVLNLFYVVFAIVFFGLFYLITIRVEIQKGKKLTAGGVRNNTLA